MKFFRKRKFNKALEKGYDVIESLSNFLGKSIEIESTKRELEIQSLKIILRFQLKQLIEFQKEIQTLKNTDDKKRIKNAIEIMADWGLVGRDMDTKTIDVYILLQKIENALKDYNSNTSGVVVVNDN